MWVPIFWVMIDFYNKGQMNQAIAYTVFLALGFILMCYSLRESYKIFLSISVSEVFLNNDARRFYTLWFKYWFFYNSAEKSLGKWDKITIFIYLTLKEWKMLIFIQVPQMFITVSPYFCKDCGSPNAAQSTKISVLGLQLMVLMFAFILYPMLRCCGTAHSGGKGGCCMGLRDYVAFLIDKQIANLLKTYLKDKHPDLYQKFLTEVEGKPQDKNVKAASPTASPSDSPDASEIGIKMGDISPTDMISMGNDMQQLQQDMSLS